MDRIHIRYIYFVMFVGYESFLMIINGTIKWSDNINFPEIHRYNLLMIYNDMLCYMIEKHKIIMWRRYYGRFIVYLS
jgi:hypothetical protein